MELTRAVGKYSGRVMTKAKLENVILVFADVGILNFWANGDVIKVALIPQKPGTKINIDGSEVYAQLKADR